MPHRVICVSRNPNIQMYESLVELLRLLADSGFSVEIVCPTHDFVEDPVWAHSGVTYRFISSGKGACRIPMTVRLLSAALTSALRERPAFIVGVDALGSILAAIVSRTAMRPLLYYGLELPQPRQSPLSWFTRIEHWSIRKAAIIVTMDRHHAEFIQSHTGASAARISLLPNAAAGSRKPGARSDYLRKRFPACAGKVLVVHAGGIGDAQQSLVLAEAAETWGTNRHLIFHAHCRMDRESYFQDFERRVRSMTHVHLNNEPVQPDLLDEVVSSADIGIAWYNRGLLGYRADLLGLAPGKIGRYLRNGIPVIVTDLPTISGYINEYKCGICIDRPEEAAQAIDTIMKDYPNYSANARRCYEDVWRPEPYLAQLRSRIDELRPPAREAGPASS